MRERLRNVPDWKPLKSHDKAVPGPGQDWGPDGRWRSSKNVTFPKLEDSAEARERPHF